ncbi:MAG: methionine aminotransferase [Bacteroidota bacterium]|nr:methionine aminotransferase [Bacteroidota bacterium]
MIHTKFYNSKRSIFSVMSELADQYGAVDMTTGKSDFPCPQKLIQLASEYLQKGYNYPAPVEGLLHLREVLATKTENLYKYSYNPQTEVTITAGHIQALTTAISSIISEGDEVIVFEPAFDTFVPAIILNGGRPVYVSMKKPDFRIDWDEVRKMITGKTRMIIINSPHNPTGAVLSVEDMTSLRKLTNGTNIVILSDEPHEHLIYDKLQHQSIALYPELAARGIIVSSPGPLYNINGWELAYCMAPANLMLEFRKIHQFQVGSANAPLQYALADYMEIDNQYMDVTEVYQGKRNYFLRLLKDSGFQFTPSQGSPYQVLDYSKLSNEPDTEFATRLVRDYGVAAIPISVFVHDKYDNRQLSFCFSKSNETLELATERLCKVVSII